MLRRYGRFVDLFNREIDAIHHDNIKYINSSIELPFNLPSLDNNIANESTDLFGLLQTCGNMQLNKMLLVLGSLTQEMDYLSKIGIEKFCDPLVLYGECQPEDQNDELISVAQMLPLLHDLLCFVNRCYTVVSNLIEQLNALINLSVTKGNVNNEVIPDLNLGVRFDIVYESLSNLAVTLINIDEIISNQVTLKRDFVNFKRIVELVSANSSRFEVENDVHKVKSLFKVINKIECELIDGEGCFKKLLNDVANVGGGKPSRNANLADQFANYIKNSCNEFDLSGELIDDHKWLGINALFVIYVWTFKKDDKRLLKTLGDYEKKINCFLVHLRGNCLVIPDRFLAHRLPRSMVDKKALETFNQQRDAILKQNLDREIKLLNFKVTNWMIRFEMELSDNDTSNNLIDALAKQQRLIEEGLELSRTIFYLVKNSISLHLQFGKAMAKNDLVAVFKAINILKGTELIFSRKKGVVVQVLKHVSQYNCCIILKILSSIKSKLISEVKKYSEKKLDLISALILACNCLNGPVLTNERRIVTSLCLSVVSHLLSSEELQKVVFTMKKLELFSKTYTLLKKWTNCEFLYFNRSVLGIYFNYFYENEASNVHELRYFLHSLSDSLQLIYNCNTTSQRDKLLKSYESEIYDQLRNEFLDKISTEFETELRLQSHRDLQLDDQSPFKRHLHDFSTLLSSEPIRFLDKLISIKIHVENYLNEMAYNLTTIALHDWKTYESMLNLAKTKYNLEFVTSQLPTQTLEQGLDVLEITRNIHIFVAKYLYNLNNQMFIERSSNNKHLNVLLIRHVANSIQTHGFGIINTTVNFTYQFLRKKFYIFSQFLYEEHIKSRLIKDLRYFRESKATKFPFERAEKLVKGIRKLGLTSDGLSYLDQFRQLISQIGNVLGFVRMLRSGALHCSSNSVNFVPELDDLSEVSFSNMTQEESLSKETIEASQNLDAILSTLNRNFTESTDYFKLLVDVFASTFRDQKNFHLRNFYVILPATTYNFVEHSIISKEKMTRKNKVGASFTDDGFAMGVAYILKLLDQFNDFESLQWFSSVKDKINNELNEATKQRAANLNNDEKLSQTTSLTMKRLDILQKEFDLLNYSLTSSKILFKATLEVDN